MDFSQLPKMSKTPVPPPTEDAEPPPPSGPPSALTAGTSIPYARQDFAIAPGGGFGFGGVWISLIGGVLCLLFGKRFGQWGLSHLTGKPLDYGTWLNGPLAGQPVAYFDVLGGAAWTEMGLFVMGIALLLDAALMFIAFRGRVPHRALVLAAVGFTGVALLINVGLACYLLTINVMPLSSLVALMVGGMVLFDHVPLLRRRS